MTNLEIVMTISKKVVTIFGKVMTISKKVLTISIMVLTIFKKVRTISKKVVTIVYASLRSMILYAGNESVMAGQEEVIILQGYLF
jgi:hypothetical protein